LLVVAKANDFSVVVVGHTGLAIPHYLSAAVGQAHGA